MLDNLRDEANSQPFFQDDQQPAEQEPVTMAEAPRSGGRFLGMTPVQRFVIAVLMMFMVCVLGAMVLLLTGKIGLYF